MSKRIVVGLDGSEYAASALRLALRRAKNYKAHLIGVAVVDTPYIETVVTGTQSGGFPISPEIVSTMMNDSKARAETLIDEFRSTCESEGVVCEDVIHSGNPAAELLREGKTADLIVTGLRTFFTSGNAAEPDKTLDALLRHPVCPVLAVTSDPEPPSNVIIAYDGSDGAARAMQAYVHVSPGLPRTVPVTLLCIAKDYEVNKYHLSRAGQYLQAHDIESTLLIREGNVAEAILALTRERYPSLVILGSPPHRGLSDRLFGSVTETIIRQGTAPVFVFH